MSEVTFRDFAGAVMGNDSKRAAEVLTELMALEAPTASAAVAHFDAQMKADASFMMKAMALRNAVTSGTDSEISSVLSDGFALPASVLPSAVAALRKRYPAPTA